MFTTSSGRHSGRLEILPAPRPRSREPSKSIPKLREGYYALGTTLKQRAAMSRKPPAAAPSAADDLYKRGQAAAAQGDLDAARELLGNALKRDEKHAGAHTLLGFTLVQEVLDQHCLVGVHINPESRVKAMQGPAPAALVQNGWRVFLVKVHNEAGVTAELVGREPERRAGLQAVDEQPRAEAERSRLGESPSAGWTWRCSATGR